MDQSVAIQETLADGDYCVITSFPAACSSQPQGLPAWAWEVEWQVSTCLSGCLPLSVPWGEGDTGVEGRKPVLTKYSVLDSLPYALNTQLSSHPL